MRQIRIAALASTALFAGLAQSASGADMQSAVQAACATARAWSSPGPACTFGGHGGCAQDRKNYTPGAFRSDDLGSTFTLDPANGGGCYGGVQVGYNYQVGSWVWGIEADASWGEVKSRTTLLQTEPAHIDSLALFDQKLTSFGTVRGRLGYTWNWGATPTLWYVTGGWAWARTSWRRPHSMASQMR